jgi:hypothetical protein
VDPYTVLAYLSGLYWLRADLDSSTLVRTVILAHALDGLLCRIIAAQNGRSKQLWTVLGWVLGIWALATLFVLPKKRGTE